MEDYKPKIELKVDGKMSEDGANKVGLRLTNVAMVGVILFGIAAILVAISCILKYC